MLVDYATKIRYLFNDLQKLFRQSGGLSSLHIPRSNIDSKEWLDRNPDNSRLDSLDKAHRQERILFEEFATKWGFKIIVDLDLPFDEAKLKAPIIRRSRLYSLLSFLKGLPKKHNENVKYEIVIDKDLDRRHSVIIVGDLFSAESLAGYQNWGFRQTMFTRHAPTIKKQIEEFDSRFEDVKKKQGSDTSVKHAIEEIKKRLVVIENQSA